MLELFVSEYLYEMSKSTRLTSVDLHQIKVAVVNNVLLSVVMIEHDLHEYILYADTGKSMFGKEF